jgi:hypothetical protein
MAKAKGSPKTGGRKKGTSNKFTKNVREAILAAFEEAGGVDYLRRVAKEDPKTFCTLLGKTMSTVVAGDEDKPRVLGVTIDRPPDETREQWLARTARERGQQQILCRPSATGELRSRRSTASTGWSTACASSSRRW